MGILQVRTEQGELTHSLAHRAVLIVIATLSLASVVAMYYGAGGLWTWVGAGGFLATLWIFTWIAVRGVNEGAG